MTTPSPRPLKCRDCGEKAVMFMRQYKLALCGPHYIDWVRQQTEHTIKKYHMFARDERILVAVSGGKDSLALWDILLALGYQADALYIGLGIDGGVNYSAESHGFVEKYREAYRAEHGVDLTLHVVDLEAAYGASLPVAAQMSKRGREKPCALCGMSKRYIMNRVAHDHGYDVLATGHNLDDEAAVLFSNVLTWKVEYLARQEPVMPPSHPGLARKVKPLFRFYERETAAYTLLRGIEYIYDECPYAEGATTARYKEVLNQLETESPGLKQQFYLRFMQAREALHLVESMNETLDLHTCPKCGQPTTNAGECSFCHTWERIQARTGHS